ncbi:nuclear transport factor 2 family protein [Niabella ginsengisoli]|uniref:Nuclear transport factor 2 family protein n=1 Tax=Niabella ginsengisoli TaxID=522298 RepID=A0ABS9SI66_9BACT|nr:nuclear transport factor 2 family protein [Niabella ginsengisoli]MCH5598063.1 nuclear transport factor 2 family protein [Niabella ginsengisoli]
MTNKQLIEKFYEAFSRKDFETMNSCYADDIVFSDPVFGFLRGDEVRAMWEMLCKNAKDFTLTFDEITEIDHEYITCKWIASYTFSGTGRKVVNRAKGFMKINDGKIIEHSDGFKMSTWLEQAFGLKGKLFGWTNFMKRKVHKKARKNLEAFMKR